MDMSTNMDGNPLDQYLNKKIIKQDQLVREFETADDVLLARYLALAETMVEAIKQIKFRRHPRYAY